jgi:CBS domain-containing protein
MRVKQIMTKDFVALKPDSTYEEAVSLLCKNNLNGAIVVDKDNSLIGYLSEKDLFRVLYPYYKSFYEHPENYANGEQREEKAHEVRYHKIENFMSKSVLTVNPDTPIMNAGALMLANRVHQFPVVENGKVVGMINREMIYKTVFKNSFKDIENC